MSKQRLTWGGNIEAQSQADEAWQRLKASKKARKKSRLTKAEKRVAKNRKRQTDRMSGVKKWKGRYREYLGSHQWAAKRRKAFAHYGSKCEVCGSTQSLQVHHRHYKTLYQEGVKDLQILCDGCHRNEHEGLRGVVQDPMTRQFLDIASSF